MLNNLIIRAIKANGWECDIPEEKWDLNTILTKKSIILSNPDIIELKMSVKEFSGIIRVLGYELSLLCKLEWGN